MRLMIIAAMLLLGTGQDRPCDRVKDRDEGNPYLPPNWTCLQEEMRKAQGERLLRAARPVGISFVAGAQEPFVLATYEGTQSWPPCTAQAMDSTLFDMNTGKVWYCQTDGRRVPMDRENYTVLVTYGAAQVYIHRPNQIGLDVRSIR